MLWFRLYLHVKLEKQHNICLTELKRCPSLCCALSRRREREREREKEREVCARWTEQTQRERERGVHAEQSRRRERERGVCAREQSKRREERERERCACWTEQRRERERERGVCACAGRARPRAGGGSIGDSQKLGLGAFLKGKRSLKGLQCS